ncbi:hypothetical protein GIB67_026955 [Kingdonia uniflora]|uniref:Uncharacterized protein n=1 Tax=Kingdonia uniflora TaxID=39325 RepID=A0A7J7P1Q4_9MAGN|nr:hypothetical protein GIB67_026955 [Kingdonia uniflora]
MEFRARDYSAEEALYTLPRVPTFDHPLSSAPPLSSPQGEVVDDKKDDFYDPLRGPTANANAEGYIVDNILDEEGVSTRRGVLSGDDLQLVEKEWVSFKISLMRKFPNSKTVSVSSMSDVIVKRAKAAKSLTNLHAEQLDDPQKKSEDVIVITREEYVSQLRELKEEINRAWKDDRVARLLMDTSVSLFYPSLFVLVTDVMDMLGDMVWDRIKRKTEYSGDGNMICSLPDNFRASDVSSSDAKETYLELAILPCWRFLHEKPWECLQRLVMMIRGLGDPLAFAYCHLYMARCAQKLVPRDRGYLISCINDIKIVLTSMTSGKETMSWNSSENKKLLISLLEPTIEWIMKCIFKGTPLRQMEDILLDFEFGRSTSKPSSNFPCVSIILHYLIKELPAETVCTNALELVQLIECCNDISFDQYMNYRLLGFKLWDGRSQPSYVDPILSKVFKVVTQYSGLDEYLKVMDAYLDIVLQYHMVGFDFMLPIHSCHFEVDNYLTVILDGIATRALDKEIGENELNILQSIFIKLISHFNDLEDTFALEHFIEILDVIHGSSRDAVNMHILHKATRQASWNNYIRDTTTIQWLFEICQALHNDIDISNIKDNDRQQSARLISSFVQMVDHGAAMEHHLAFLIECRGAFGKLNDLKVRILSLDYAEVLVHLSNNLVIKGIKVEDKLVSFVKSCITFSEVTIPSISGSIKQMNLYLETAEVALLGGLVSHTDGLLDSAISCLGAVDITDGSQSPIDVDVILSLIQKLCGLLILVPGNPDQGVTHFPKSILSIVDSQPWKTPRVKITMLCAIVSLSATLSQKMLPYHANNTEILSNDLLFFEESTYDQEFASISHSAVMNMVDAVQKEKYRNARGSMALEACNCILSSYRTNHEVSRICSELIDIAKSCLSANDKYLQSTMNFFDKRLSARDAPGKSGLVRSTPNHVGHRGPMGMPLTYFHHHIFGLIIGHYHEAVMALSMSFALPQP